MSNREKSENLQSRIALTNIKYKSLKNQLIDDAKLIKNNHGEILKLQEKCKNSALMIKTEKFKHNKSQREGETAPNPISTEQQILIGKNKDLKKEVHK